jgi:Ca2+-binding EF-hand superfamily protein
MRDGKRYRKIKRIKKVEKALSIEEYNEIVDAFNLFDKDGSNTIDVGELRDSLKVLGIHMNLNEVKMLMEKADKDGSGTIDLEEFLPLMASKFEARDQQSEIAKAFKAYDDDDNGRIELQNLQNAADTLCIDVTLEELEEMMRIGDFKNQGYVDLEDFMNLMEKS